MKPKFTICPYRNDAARVAEFFLSSHQEDKTIVPVTENTWQAFVSLPSNFGGKDFAVAEVDDLIVALLSSKRRDNQNNKVRHFRIIVHPHFRQCGIGKALLERVISQDDGDDVVLQSTCPEEWVAEAEFLTHNGFTRVHQELSMHRSVRQPVPTLSLPKGDNIRNYAGASDDSILACLHNSAYSNSFGFTPVNEAEFAGQRAFPGCRIRILEHNRIAVGFCQTVLVLEEERTGRIENLVVSPNYLRRGFGRALLIDAVRYLFGNRLTYIELFVDADNQPAVQLYKTAGFEQTGCTHTYCRMRG
jgi:mycothiol synthase